MQVVEYYPNIVTTRQKMRLVFQFQERVKLGLTSSVRHLPAWRIHLCPKRPFFN